MRGGKYSNPNAREKSFSFVEDHLGIFANNFHGLTSLACFFRLYSRKKDIFYDISMSAYNGILHI